MDHASRLSALADRLDAPLMVSSLPNLRYLVGFEGSNGFLVIRPDRDAVFITDGRYGELAERLLADLPGTDLIVYTSGLWQTLGGSFEGLDSIGLETHVVTWDFVRNLTEQTGVEPVATTGIVEELRRVKDSDEVAALQAAATAGDVAFSALHELSGGDIDERGLGWALIDAMRRQGGEAAGWEPIVAAGAGASIPHYRSGRRPIGSGLLLLDYGCVVDGYHSDMSRTVWLEGSPDDEMVRVYRAVAESQEAGIAAVAPGSTCNDVDAAVRDVLRAYGYEKQFLHSTGHGVGLEIHEAPWVRAGNDDPLRVGDVITVEPGVYLPGIGGVRIEDMVLVTDGGPFTLTVSSREMQPA